MPTRAFSATYLTSSSFVVAIICCKKSYTRDFSHPAQAVIKHNVLVETASSISTKSSGDISTDSVYWKYPGSAGLNANQAFFNDYSTDGTGSSLSLDAFLNLAANYQKNRVKWDNSFAAKYGFIYSSEFTGDDLLRKNMDEFNLSSKFGDFSHPAQAVIKPIRGSPYRLNQHE